MAKKHCMAIGVAVCCTPFSNRGKCRDGAFGRFGHLFDGVGIKSLFQTSLALVHGRGREVVSVGDVADVERLVFAAYLDDDCLCNCRGLVFLGPSNPSSPPLCAALVL